MDWFLAVDVLLSRLVKVLDLLWRERERVAAAAEDRWQSAVGLLELEESAADLADLRWLVNRGVVEHGYESAAAECGQRVFELAGDRAFRSDSAFVLSPFGEHWVETVFEKRREERMLARQNAYALTILDSRASH